MEDAMDAGGADAIEEEGAVAVIDVDIDVDLRFLRPRYVIYLFILFVV